MEFFPSHTLGQACKVDGGLSFTQAAGWAKDIATGMEVAHQVGIIHRDLKPANVMLSREGDILIPKVADFGLAKIFAEDEDEDESGKKRKHTRTGVAMGTPAYMSPEQVTGEEVDERSDIFSLGVLIYEMLSGQLPFRGDYEQAILYSIINTDPEPISRPKGGIPEALENIIIKCLEKKPAKNPGNPISFSLPFTKSLVYLLFFQILGFLERTIWDFWIDCPPSFCPPYLGENFSLSPRKA